MIVLGLLLMLACAALAVDAIVQNTQVMHAIAFNQPVSHLSLGAIFIAGAVTGLLFAMGLAMMTGGVGRASRKRRERRAAAREARAENEALREHNDRLAAELENTRASAYPEEPGTGAVATDVRERTSGRHRL
jgi:uncharacterized integral membrane protein